MEAEGPVGANLPHTWRRGLQPGWGTHKQAGSKETPATFTLLKNQSRNRLPLGNKFFCPIGHQDPTPSSACTCLAPILADKAHQQR